MNDSEDSEKESKIVIRSWYVSVPRLLELLDLQRLTPDIKHALFAPGSEMGRAILANSLGPQLLGYFQKEKILPFYRLAAEGRLAPGVRFTYQGHFYGNGFSARNRTPHVSLSENLKNILPGKKLMIEFSKSGITTETAYTRLSGSTNLFAFCSVSEIDQENIRAVPYVIGDLVEGGDSHLDVPFVNNLRIPIQSIDQFKGINFDWNPSPNDFNRLKDISEQEVKALFCKLLGEAEIQKDWGGEECDIFSSNLSIEGRRYSAAFLLKGPAKFHEMTLADCGKNGDQIYRLFNTPADVFIVQHCHKITPAVRKTVEAYALSNYSRNCRYLLIDGYDTARILRSNKIL